VKSLKGKQNDNGEKLFEAVNLQHDRRVTVGGKDWLDVGIEIKGKQRTVWQRVRVYTGREGTLHVVGTLTADDLDTRRHLNEALDAIEILPPP
jgi:hypothetical protein